VGIRRQLTAGLAMAAACSVAATFTLAGAAAAAPAGSEPEADNDPVATLEIIEPSVSVQREGKENFKPAKDGQKLRVGDTVQTDDTGFAQVNYTDESFTRLDVNTTFTIVSLSDDEGNRQIKGSVESGQTWNRTSALTESESFEQEGAGATAAVTGTAFVVSCVTPTSCAFTSVVDGIELTTVDGEVQELDPLEQCGSTEITQEDADLCAAVEQVTLDALLANAWILENLFIDGTQGLEGVIIVEDGVVTFTPTPPADEPPAGPTADPPVVDASPVNIETTSGETPDYTTGPDTIVSSQDELTTIFTLQASNPGHTIFFIITVLPDPTFGQLLVGNAAVVENQQYAEDTEFTFDPVQIEPDCDDVGEDGLDFSDCFTYGNPENQGQPLPNPYPYPTGDDTPVDYGDGTVRWYGSFTFIAVNEQGDHSAETTVRLEAVEDMCNEGNRTANAVAPCPQPGG
jgi:hypothetical protein